MLLGFLSLPGQLIMGLGMGELDGVAGVGGLYVTDGWASEQDGQSVFGSFCLMLPRSHAVFLHWLTKINGPFSLLFRPPCSVVDIFWNRKSFRPSFVYCHDTEVFLFFDHFRLK